MRNWDLRELLVQVNSPSPIWQGQVLIRRCITPIRGRSNPIRQVVPMISHICSYPPHHSRLYPPSPIFLFTTPLSSQNTKLCHPDLSRHAMITSWLWVQHTPSTAYTEYSIHRVQHTPGTSYTKYSIHRIQHTPSTAYTKYSMHRGYHTPSTAYTEDSIHRVQHALSTASTQDCLSSLPSNDLELTPECSFSFWRTPLHEWPPSASALWELKGKLTLSHFHRCELTNWWIESQHPAHHPWTASKY